MRPDSLLLKGRALTEAERWAAANPEEVSRVESEYLITSRKYQEIAGQDKEVETRLAQLEQTIGRYQKRVRLLCILFVVALVMLMVGWGYALWLARQ